jgi:hypothetical protein
MLFLLPVLISIKFVMEIQSLFAARSSVPDEINVHEAKQRRRAGGDGGGRGGILFKINSVNILHNF